MLPPAQLVEKMAHLAKLELTPEESQRFAAQLGDILNYVDQLKEADIQDVKPMLHPTELPTALRDDVVVPSPVDAQGKPKVLQSAPQVANDSFQVPPIL